MLPWACIGFPIFIRILITGQNNQHIHSKRSYAVIRKTNAPFCIERLPPEIRVNTHPGAILQFDLSSCLLLQVTFGTRNLVHVDFDAVPCVRASLHTLPNSDSKAIERLHFWQFV